MIKPTNVIDATPPERNTQNHKMRTQILLTIRDRLDEVIGALPALGMPLKDTVLLVLTKNMKERVPFPLPDTMEDGTPTIYMVPEARSGFATLLRQIYPFAGEDSLGHFNEPPPPGFIYVVMASTSGFTSSAFGEYVFPNTVSPNSANN